jgi:hypothetical protein
MRNFINSIKTVFAWLPIIWKDRQWDSHYYEVILLHKIKLQRKYFEKRQFFVGYEDEVKWMKKCEYLLTMLINNTYWLDEWDGKAPSENGLDWKTWNYKRLIDNRKPGGFSEEFKFLDTTPKCYADIWEYKARHLFWKIFIWRYERWWD